MTALADPGGFPRFLETSQTSELPYSPIASFPDSTPQIFIALCIQCDKKLSAIKSWGVESGNEANSRKLVDTQ